jgi:carbamoylphosphate synthase small subunit
MVIFSNGPGDPEPFGCNLVAKEILANNKPLFEFVLVIK